MPSYPKKTVFTLLMNVLIVTHLSAETSAGEFLQNITVTADGSAAYVENASRSALDSTDAMVYEAGVTASGVKQLSRNWIATVGTEAGVYTMPEYSLNNSYAIGVRGGLQRKFGLGPMATVLKFETAYSYKEARIHSDDGGTLSGSVSISKRVLPTLRLGASMEWLEHYAKAWSYDYQQRTYLFEAAWDFADGWRLSGNGGRLSGDVVATAALSTWNLATTGGLGPAVGAYYPTVPHEEINSFGPGWMAYTVQADIDLWEVGVTRTLSERTSVDLRLGSAYMTNIVNIRYLTKSVALAIAHRF